MSNRLFLKRALTLPEEQALRHAWLEAKHLGFPLDARIDIKPADDLDPLEAHRWFHEDWNWLNGWCRRNVGVFYAVATRECFPDGDRRGRCEHFHWNVHVGSDDRRNKLRKAWRWRRSGTREVSLRQSDYEDRIGPNGERGNAHTYMTKQRGNWQRSDPPESKKPKVTIQRGGKVLGKRYAISASLRTRPIDIAMPRPLRAVR